MSPWEWMVDTAADWWTGLWSALLAADPGVWEILGSIGSVLALATSVLFAIDSGFRAQRDRKELIALRKTDDAKERLVVSGRVASWITDTYNSDPVRNSYKRTVTLHLANESDEPVFNATTVMHLGDGTRMIGPLGTPTPIPVVPPHRELTWDISAGIAAFPNNTRPLVQLAFTDSKSRRWLRAVDGTLSESTGADVFHYASEDLERAEEQLGEFDPYRNPMSVAQAFAAALWVDPENFNLDVFLALLDEEANGWKGAWEEIRVEHLRKLLSKYNNLATLASYATPKVAYARLFSDGALKQVTKAGTSLAVEGLIITLVHHSENGWRVFGVGPQQIRPDEIKFPDGEFAL